jgi:hypothetical protein
MNFKTLAFTTWLLHTAKKGSNFVLKKLSLTNSASANFVDKRPPIGKNVNL